MMKSSYVKGAAVACLVSLLLVGAISAQRRPSSKTSSTTSTDCSGTDDAALATQVSTKLSETPLLAGQEINVAVKYGVVTLSGTVSSVARKRKAANIARSIKCVKKVLVGTLNVRRPIKMTLGVCCCNGECYESSGQCPTCNLIGLCVDAYKKDPTQPGAKEAFYDCIHKQSP